MSRGVGAGPPEGGGAEGSSARTGHRWAAWGAYALLAVPFGIVVVRYLLATSPVYLSDDLALIDLDTRNALAWHQQLGPFDRFGWDHPGPCYFYLLSLSYRVLGNGARAEFVGAIVINALSALAVVWLVQRRAGSWAAWWAAASVALLLVALSFTGGFDVTYSEGPAGAVVSPWNPTVVLLPLLLTGCLCAAAAADGSLLCLLGAALTGSFCVQTDISTLPEVAVFGVGAMVVMVAAAWRSAGQGRWSTRLSAWWSTWRPATRAGAWLVVVGLVVLVLAWVPPVVQQLTGHPGNLSEIVDFFTRAHPAHGATAGLWSVVSVDSVLLFGPSSIMLFPLGVAGGHAGLVLALALLLQLGALAVALAARQRLALWLAVAGLAGSLAAGYSVTDVVGPVYGYLVLSAIVMPILSLTALGIALGSWVDGGSRVAWRGLELGAGLAVAVVLCIKMVGLPPLQAVSNPGVAASTALATAHLASDPHPFGVQDAGLPLVETEEFIGLVNRLDQQGLRPRVSEFWAVQFGPSLVQRGNVARTLVLEPWTAGSPHQHGYLGRTGQVAVLLVPGNGIP